MDEDERWKLGAYATLEESISACKQMVEACLVECYQPGMDSEALYCQYVMFEDNPFILGHGEPGQLSAENYANAFASAMCPKRLAFQFDRIEISPLGAQ